MSERYGNVYGVSGSEVRLISCLSNADPIEYQDNFEFFTMIQFKSNCSE